MWGRGRGVEEGGEEVKYQGEGGRKCTHKEDYDYRDEDVKGGEKDTQIEEEVVSRV